MPDTFMIDEKFLVYNSPRNCFQQKFNDWGRFL